MRITPANIDRFRVDFKLAMEALSSKYEIDIKLGSASYDDNTFRATLNVKNQSTASGLSVDQEYWNKNCHYFDLKQEDFGKSITLDGGKMGKITGINPRSKKYNISVTLFQGGIFGVRPSFVRESLKKRETNDSIVIIPTQNKPTVAELLDIVPGNTRKDQVLYLVKSGIISPSEIAKKLGTNASYVSTILRNLK